MKTLFLLSTLTILVSPAIQARNYVKDLKTTEKETFSLFDPEDGYFDIGSFLDKPYGFYPMAMPITEPAVGYGAAIVPVFIKRPKDKSALTSMLLGQ